MVATASGAAAPQELPEPDVQRWMFEHLALIREFEERVAALRQSGVLQGSAHLYAGQEAVAVGVCARLNRDDYVASTHRGHGHAIAKGVDVARMMAELFGGATGIVGAGTPLALGAALSAQKRRTTQVAVAFFGDGAMGQGTVYECLNMA